MEESRSHGLLAPWIFLVSSGQGPQECCAQLPPRPLFHSTEFVGGVANTICGVSITGHSLPGAPPWAGPWAHSPPLSSPPHSPRSANKQTKASAQVWVPLPLSAYPDTFYFKIFAPHFHFGEKAGLWRSCL